MRLLTLSLLLLTFGSSIYAAQPDETTASKNADEAKVDPEIFHAQVLLDQMLFSPGAIDGLSGRNFEAALEEFQEQHELEVTKKIDEKTSSALTKAAGEAPSAEALSHDGPTIAYKITQEDAATTFTPIPEGAEMATLARQEVLFYGSMPEMLAERFHTTPAFLEHLNPDAKWEAGDTVEVPNVLATQIQVPDKKKAATKDNSKDTSAPETRVERPVTVIVSKEDTVLTAVDKKGRVVFHAPVTAGSKHDPLPLGEWKINGVERYPVFHFNPDLFWDARADDEKAKIPPGPKNPVGVAWIDISKPHYGLHGTPNASKVGYTESHGCVRLTNWDVLRLAEMVKPGAKVYFVETAKERKSKAEKIRNAKADEPEQTSDNDENNS